ncbi:uncharacterized mitochondrial protein AtMg00240-like [Humulus lupulus]|uniref:uncharacterized mitochondrial protein AtMg00240-like n=1 Tax=Humulus lupulus TaxID=3486 RepID=UPI002B406BBA|nr:uncharacterized mitochondrial protein AtMg00240-like [Humulus lupulus]
MEPNLKLSKDEGDVLPDPTSYRSIIGKLIYLTITWADISFAVNRLSQFLSLPRLPHLKAAQRILQYLKGRPGEGLCFPSSSQPQLKAYAESNFTAHDLHLKVFLDSDWGSCLNTRRSVTGYWIFLSNSLISWK